jgi:hypothetical protein
MDPESQRALIVVLVVGSIVFAIGTITLIVVFRRFGNANAGGRSHKRLMASLIGFIFLCCLAMFALSYWG